MADRDDIERSLSESDGDADGIDVADEGSSRRDGERDIVSLHLARAWQSFAPSPDLDARVRARLTSSTAATFGALSLGAASGPGRAPSAWASLQASGKVGVLVGAGLLAVGFLSGYVARSSSNGDYSSGGVAARTQPSARVAASARVPAGASPRFEIERFEPAGPVGETIPHDAPPESAAPRGETPASTQRAGRRELAGARKHVERAARDAPPAGAPVIAPSEPSEELLLLQRAERAVRADNAALALALIAELETRYPRSTLLEERSAIELLAHCRAGATDARARAARFLRQHPQSLYTGRVGELCLAETANSSTGALTNPAHLGHGSDQKEPR